MISLSNGATDVTIHPRGIKPFSFLTFEVTQLRRGKLKDLMPFCFSASGCVLA